MRVARHQVRERSPARLRRRRGQRRARPRRERELGVAVMTKSGA